MAQQQQNISLSAPGFYGINTEQSPLDQDQGYCTIATNCVVDRLGRIGSRRGFGEFTTANNLTYSTDPATVTTEEITHTIASGAVNGLQEQLCTVSVIQKNSGGTVLQSDYFLCILVEVSPGVLELNEIALPTMVDSSALTLAHIKMFNDKAYIFSDGNDTLVYDGASPATNLADAVGFLPPQDDSGTIAATINGDVSCAAYGRLWVSGVGDNYNRIYYSDLLIATQWYDGKAVPTDAQNTAGIIDVDQYWPLGTDRIMGIEAHNGFLYVFGRQSILVYTGVSADPAAADGLTLQDAIPNIGLVSRDAVTNTGSDVLFIDDGGVRSIGRTIQEKSAPIGDLTMNVRRDFTTTVANTDDKTTISLDFWAEDALIVALFPEKEQAYCMEARSPSPSGGLKVTRWTSCRFNRSVYYEFNGKPKVLMTSNQDSKGLLRYTGTSEYDNEPFELEWQSKILTFGQPASSKFIKQIDYTISASDAPFQAFATWGYGNNITDRVKSLTVDASPAALYSTALYGTGKYGARVYRVQKYRVNTKGSGEDVIIGFRAQLNGSSCSIQEINIQALLGRLN